MNIKKIKYTIKHRKAFRKVEKDLLGYNTIRSFFYDIDKIFLYLFFSKDKVQIIHRKLARHHFESIFKKKRMDYIQMIIDWECARFTKPDKPLNARETLYKFYPQLKNEIEPLLKELNL